MMLRMALFQLTANHHVDTNAITEILYKPAHKEDSEYFRLQEEPPAHQRFVPSSLQVNVKGVEDWIELDKADADAGWTAYQKALVVESKGEDLVEIVDGHLIDPRLIEELKLDRPFRPLMGGGADDTAVLLIRLKDRDAPTE